ncbi:PrgI family mobile element protein (plasmid) [Alkalihalophilus sp. As8PL]|uniref:PrgI family mobile element protein n=1 Tax=Alkalihalophilus sp. As8PL TaxID=3237103 RepID=A0AB39BNQ4_9BACI
MRKVSVPVDMASEQKILLGVISMRQLIYVLLGGGAIYSVTPLVWSLPLSLIGNLMLNLIVAIPFAIIVILLGFMKQKKYNMFYDFYFITKLSKKTQTGVWRKGKRREDWM